MDKRDFEKMLRKSAFHGTASFLAWCVVVALVSDFLGGVAKGIGINELWKWFVLLPAGIWFLRFMETK